MENDWIKAGHQISERFGIELGLSVFIATNLPTKPEIFERLFPYLKRFEPGEWTGEPMQMKQCFNNALRAHYESLGQLSYVEGVAISVIPMSHAWVTADGIHALDPTWKSIKTENCPYLGFQFTAEAIEFIDTRIKPSWNQYLCNRQILNEICLNPSLFLSI